jgi:hypothetical protein
VHLGASLLEQDFVHRRPHEMDTAAMLRFKIFDGQGIGDGARIEPLTLV